MSDQIATFNECYDERSPLLSQDQSGLHGSITAEAESKNVSTSQSAFVSGVGSVPQGGSLLTFPIGSSVSINHSGVTSGGGATGHGTGQIQQETNTLTQTGNPVTAYGSNYNTETVTPREERRLAADANRTDSELVLPHTHTTPIRIRSDPQQSCMQEFVKLCKKCWKPILFSFVCALLVLLVTGVTVVPLSVTDPCKTININITGSVFTNDTILVLNSSETKFCGQRPTISIPDYKTDEQDVHIYEVDCNALKWHQTNFTCPPQQRDDRDVPFTLFVDEAAEYMTQGAQVTFEGNLTISSNVGSEVFICVFDDIEFYNKHFNSNEHWRNATSAALECYRHGNITNETITFEYTVKFNKTSYYYIGIAGTHPIDNIHWTYQGWTGVLNHSDYKSSELQCMVSNGCTPTKACVVAYAEPPADGRNSFSSVRAVAKKTVLTGQSIASIAVGSVALFVVVLIVLVGGLSCYRVYMQA